MGTGYNMKIKRLYTDAILPVKAHAGDLGYDLFCHGIQNIEPNQVKLIPTGIAIQFPKGYGGLIRDRSSIATKQYIFTVAGVIDNGYTGHIQIAMFNAGQYPTWFRHGDKIAQLVLIPTVDFPIEEADEIISLDGRGEKGFGSTGKTHVTQNKDNSWL